MKRSERNNDRGKQRALWHSTILCGFSRSWYRVVSSFMQRMAAPDAFHSHPPAFDNAIFRDGLRHVFRARRYIPARRREQRRKQPLIDANDEDENAAHLPLPQPLSLVRRGELLFLLLKFFNRVIDVLKNSVEIIKNFFI